MIQTDDVDEAEKSVDEVKENANKKTEEIAAAARKTNRESKEEHSVG